LVKGKDAVDGKSTSPNQAGSDQRKYPTRLGDNPSQEEMDELRDYGLEQFAQNFPELGK